MSVLEGEGREFEAACARYGQEKQAVMERVQARRDTVRGIVEAAVLPAAESPARWARPVPLSAGCRLLGCTDVEGLRSGGSHIAVDYDGCSCGMQAVVKVCHAVAHRQWECLRRTKVW